MNATKAVFLKTTSCPSSNLLLYYRNKCLAAEVELLIKHHLAECDFCGSEIPLLAHYVPPQRDEPKLGEIPMNLRILAESLLAQGVRRHSRPKVTGALRKILNRC